MGVQLSNVVVATRSTRKGIYTVNTEIDSPQRTNSKADETLTIDKVESNELCVSTSNACKCLQWMKSYLKKWGGKQEERPPRVTYTDLGWTFVGCVISIGVVSLLHYRLLHHKNFLFLIGSFGATAVLLFAQPKAVVSQPRNMIGGQLICSVVGCIIRILLVDQERSVAALLSVTISTVLMQYTETLHPPAGATALIAVIGVHPKEWSGFLFIFIPILSGQLVMLFTALIINNIPSNRSYPTFWW